MFIITASCVYTSIFEFTEYRFLSLLRHETVIKVTSFRTRVFNEASSVQ